jgi:hypothetical protein
MPDYSKSKIYTVRCHLDQSLIYVGSTTQALSKRWGDHKQEWKRGKHLPYHHLIQDINDWYIELYEECPCNNNEELLKKEYEVMRKLSTLNSRRRHPNPDQFDNPSKLP